jgi:hypothetical protein
MPQIQILPENQGFGSQLGEALGGGLSQGINASLSQMLEQKKQMNTGKALAEYLGQPDMASQLGQLPFEIQKIIASSHGMKQQEAAMNRQNATRSIGDMRQFLDKGNIGLTLNAFTQEGMGDRSAFDTASLNLEKLAADMVGKGTLNQQRFQYLKERLPSSMKTDSQNRAILDEWEKTLSEHEENKPSAAAESKEKALFDPENPEHKSKALKLHKALKDKEKVRQQLKREFRFDVS